MAKVSHAGKIPLLTCAVRISSRSNETEKAFEKNLDEIWNEVKAAQLEAVRKTLAARGFTVKDCVEAPPLRGIEIWAGQVKK